MDIEGLKKLAEAATPGPWHSPGLGEVHDDANNCVIVDVCWRENNEDGTPADLDSSVGNGTQADADFIAAANPQTVLALIRELEEARNDEREGIACFLEAAGHHDLASQVFAGMTRPVNEQRRGAAIDAARKKQ